MVVDGQFLADYRPCFNSVLHDSMTLIYRMMWPVTRPVGAADPLSEGLHRAAVDRRAPTLLEYQPKNVADYDKRGNGVVYDTARVPRGTPC